MKVAVALAPDRAPRHGSGVAVVVDVLRATSTLTMALVNGARDVTPLATTEEALARRARQPDALACGERDGRIVPGFDLGNSPLEYTRERVTGRGLLFASTNGSLAMRAALAFPRRLLGAFVNASAVLRAIERERDVTVICAGKLGGFALEDAAFAGWLCARLAVEGATLDDPAARLAVSLAPAGPAAVHAVVEGSSHGRYLRSLGPEFARDVEFCGTLDVVDRAFTF